MTTTGFSVTAVEPFPELGIGDDLATTVITTLTTGTDLRDGDIIVVASKIFPGKSAC